MTTKKAKKAETNDRVQKKYPIVTSDVCERCTTPCVRGMAYVGRMTAAGTTFGKGVVCKKEA